jgi:hypothetical protein
MNDLNQALEAKKELDLRLDEVQIALDPKPVGPAVPFRYACREGCRACREGCWGCGCREGCRGCHRS